MGRDSSKEETEGLGLPRTGVWGGGQVTVTSRWMNEDPEAGARS